MFNYLKDTEVPTKLDGLLQRMKIWDVDVAGGQRKYSVLVVTGYRTGKQSGKVGTKTA